MRIQLSFYGGQELWFDPSATLMHMDVARHSMRLPEFHLFLNRWVRELNAWKNKQGNEMYQLVDGSGQITGAWLPEEEDYNEGGLR